MSPPFEFLCFDLIFAFNDQEFLKTIKLDMFLFFHQKIRNTKGPNCSRLLSRRLTDIPCTFYAPVGCRNGRMFVIIIVRYWNATRYSIKE